MVIVKNTLIISSLVLCCPALALSQVSGNTSAKTEAAPVERRDAAIDAATSLIGEALFLRCFCSEDTLHFDLQGRLQAGEKTKPVDWTLAGMDVQKVTRKNANELELDGIRVFIRYAADRHEFERHPQKTEAMQVFVAVSADVPGTQRALHTMFAQGIDRPLQKSMPPCWQHYFDPGVAWVSDSLGSAAIHNPTSPQDGAMIEPKLMRRNDADYTPEAARGRIRGTSRIRFVVDVSGTPQRLTVLQPLGYGLDEAAVNAASKLRFSPGLLNGVPVPTYEVLNQEFGTPQ